MLKSPDEVVSIVPPKTATERTELKVLDAYVDQIRLWSSAAAKANSIRFETTEVEVTPWAARAIHRFCNSPTPTHGEIEDLITQGVALMAKCQTDLSAGTDSAENRNEVYARQAEMMLDVAVGTVVVHELQSKGNALLATGDNEGVRELNQFQHRVRNVVQDVRRSLGESERRRASELASVFGEDIGDLDAGDDSPFLGEPTPNEAPGKAGSAAKRTSKGPLRPGAPARAQQPTAKRPRRQAPAVFKMDEPHTSRSAGWLLAAALVAGLGAAGVYGLVRSVQAPIQSTLR